MEKIDIMKMTKEEWEKLSAKWTAEHEWANEPLDPDEKWGRWVEICRRQWGEEGEEVRRIPMTQIERNIMDMEMDRSCWESELLWREGTLGEENRMALEGMDYWLSRECARLGHEIAHWGDTFEQRMATAVHMFGVRPVINWGHRAYVQVHCTKNVDGDRIIEDPGPRENFISPLPSFLGLQVDEWGKMKWALYEMVLCEMCGVGWGGFYLGMWERGELEQALKIDETEWKIAEETLSDRIGGVEVLYQDPRKTKVTAEAAPAAKQMLHATLIAKERKKGYYTWNAMVRRQLWEYQWVLTLLAKKLETAYENVRDINWNTDSGEWIQDEKEKFNRAKGVDYWDWKRPKCGPMKDDGDLEREDEDGKKWVERSREAAKEKMSPAKE